MYDVTDGTVRLSKDAWLSDGQNEITYLPREIEIAAQLGELLPRAEDAYGVHRSSPATR